MGGVGGGLGGSGGQGGTVDGGEVGWVAGVGLGG